MAERDQLRSSAAKSSNSRQSEMALESRKSLNTLVNWDTTDIVPRSTSMVDLSEVIKAEEGTAKH